MSSSKSGAASGPVTKKLGKGERKVPSASQRAKKFYPAEDEVKPKKVRKTVRPTRLRNSLQPGTVLILLAGRFRGKRVVLLRHLSQGVLLVTGPFKINGVPLRRVNSRYVIATGASIDIKGIDSTTLDRVAAKDYFAREKSSQRKGEDAFFSQGQKEKASTSKTFIELCTNHQKSIDSTRVNDQKSIDKPLLAAISKVPHFKEYLASSFSLRKGDKPHAMKW